MGAWECPCLSNTSTTAGQVAAQLEARGVSRDYGFNGCRAYDYGKDIWGCEGASRKDLDAIHCFYQWCWVDKEKCSTDATRCPRIGSTDNIYCRKRRKVQSTVFKDPQLYYSFETCGMIDVYNFNPFNLFPEMEKRSLLVTPMYIRAEVFTGPKGQWTGAMYELVKLSLQSFPDTAIEVADPPISPESKAQVQDGSQYTACVHDVAIHRLDMCIAPIWLTPDRLAMSTFLPSLFEDAMNFLMHDTSDEGSFHDDLAKPFRPFTPGLWCFVTLFLVFSGCSLLCAEGKYNGDDFPPEEDRFRRLARTLYFGFMAFFSGGPAHNPMTWPGRLITLGLSFFVLIATASYTANLASFLVDRTQKTGVRNFEEAVFAGHRICVNKVIEGQLRNTYRNLRLDQLRTPLYEDDCPQMLARGEVQGIILSTEGTEKLYSGAFVQQDCSPGKPFVDDPTVCPRNTNRLDLTSPSKFSEYDPQRDCHVVVVGPPPLRIRTSFPVNRKLQRPMSWALSRQMSRGRYKKLQDSFNSSSWRASRVCPLQSASKASLSLPVQSISGTVLVSTGLLVAGLIWATLKVAGYCPAPVKKLQSGESEAACKVPSDEQVVQTPSAGSNGRVLRPKGSSGSIGNMAFRAVLSAPTSVGSGGSRVVRAVVPNPLEGRAAPGDKAASCEP